MSNIESRTAIYKYGARKAARFGRADRHWYASWFWEIDRVLLLLVVALIGIGLIAVAAASPAAAIGTQGPLAFFWKQAMWAAIGVPAMIFTSMLPTNFARRASLGLAAFFSVLLAFVPIIGLDANGATRWIGFEALKLQPSEFLKPFYVVSMAWVLSLRATNRQLPFVPLTGAITGVIALFLMQQPDFGQTVVFCGVWVALLMIAGVPMRFLYWLGGLGLGGLVAMYLFYENGRERIDSFLGLSTEVSSGPTHTDLAYSTITAGGLIGVGPGAGTHKFRLPEAQNDYIFSVIGEEFGLIACATIALLYLAIVVRVLIKLLDEEDNFLILAAGGLATQFGLQAIINMAVNVQIVPSKGMTLPFISYGGSSLLAVSVGFGLLLAFTKRNPYLKRSPYVVKWSDR